MLCYYWMLGNMAPIKRLTQQFSSVVYLPPLTIKIIYVTETVTLPSGRRQRSARNKTSHHRNGFSPSAVGLVNQIRDPHSH